MFGEAPNQGECAFECDTWSTDRFVTSGPPGPEAGLNCSDGNEGWIEDTSAENARIGAGWSSGTKAGFVGTTGDRGFDTSQLEKTWGGWSEGESFDSDVMIFVR